MIKSTLIQTVVLKKIFERKSKTDAVSNNKHTNFSIQKSCQNKAWLVRPPKYLPLPLIIEGRQKRLAAARGNWLNENYLKFWVYTRFIFLVHGLEKGGFQNYV